MFGLAEENIASLTIANRTVERGQSLSDAISQSIADVKAIPMTNDALEKGSADADLIVNCTSMGMKHSDAEGRSPLEARLMPSNALVYDMVYNPSETQLLMEAKKAGARTLGGLTMLIYQGAAAFERWTGKDAPVGVMFRAGEKALAGLAAG